MGWIWVEKYQIWVLNSERDDDGKLTNCTPGELSHRHDKKGKYIQEDWHPDEDFNQTFMVVKRMRDQIFSKRMNFIKNLERIIAKKYPGLKENQTINGLWNLFYMEPVDILKAAMAAMPEEQLCLGS
jgi:hypothetical protein